MSQQSKVEQRIIKGDSICKRCGEPIRQFAKRDGDPTWRHVDNRMFNGAVTYYRACRNAVAEPVASHAPTPAPAEHCVAAKYKHGTPSGGDPIDCDFPFCGCFSMATKTIEALQEYGWGKEESFVIELAGIYGLGEDFLRALPTPTLGMWKMLVREEAKRHKSDRDTMENFRKELCDLKFGASAPTPAPEPPAERIHKLILEAVDRCDPTSDGERVCLYGNFERFLREASAPAAAQPDRQFAIDLSNLRFYADMAKEHEWHTHYLHYGVIVQTLREIADRMESRAALPTTNEKSKGKDQ